MTVFKWSRLDRVPYPYTFWTFSFVENPVQSFRDSETYQTIGLFPFLEDLFDLTLVLNLLIRPVIKKRIQAFVKSKLELDHMPEI